MPSIERRCEQTPRTPLKHLFATLVLPNLGGALAVEDADHLLEKMPFGLKGATRGDLADVHAGHAFHTVKVHEGGLAARARPRRYGDLPDILDSITVDHGNALAGHPFKIGSLLKRRHQCLDPFILRHRNYSSPL